MVPWGLGRAVPRLGEGLGIRQVPLTGPCVRALGQNSGGSCCLLDEARGGGWGWRDVSSKADGSRRGREGPGDTKFSSVFGDGAGPQGGSGRL